VIICNSDKLLDNVFETPTNYGIDGAFNEDSALRDDDLEFLEKP